MDHEQKYTFVVLRHQDFLRFLFPQHNPAFLNRITMIGLAILDMNVLVYVMKLYGNVYLAKEAEEINRAT